MFGKLDSQMAAAVRAQQQEAALKPWPVPEVPHCEVIKEADIRDVTDEVKEPKLLDIPK